MKPIILSTILSVFVSLFGCDQNRDETKSSPPNIIFILSDDLSYKDLSCYGQKRFSTPNIDRIAQEGMLFWHAYAGAPECAPTRGSLITGKHMGHATVRLNRSHRGQEYIKDEEETVAEVLKNAGYATGWIGKWGIGLPGSEGVPHKQGFDYAFGFYDQSRGHTFYPHYLFENGKKIEYPENFGFDMKAMYRYTNEGLDAYPNKYNEEGSFVARGVKDPTKVINSENLFQKEALSFIRKNQDQPFFLYYATQLPHGPLVTPNLGEFQHKAGFSSLKDKEWAAMTTHMDDGVGKMMDLLKELNIDENTIIFFAGDNGYSQWGYYGRPRWEDNEFLQNRGPFRGGKFINLEGGNRVPMMVRWPGQIKAGTESNLPVAFWDFLATAADLAQTKPSQSHDGISFLPTLLGHDEQQEKHEFLYWERVHEQAVRIGDFRAYRPHPDSALQVYYIVEDTYSTTDIAEERPDIVSKAKELFVLEHTDSEWFTNPGDSREKIDSLENYIIQNDLKLWQDTLQ